MRAEPHKSWLAARTLPSRIIVFTLRLRLEFKNKTNWQSALHQLSQLSHTYLLHLHQLSHTYHLLHLNKTNQQGKEGFIPVCSGNQTEDFG